MSQKNCHVRFYASFLLILFIQSGRIQYEMGEGFFSLSRENFFDT
jgi:hypothetical protein